MARNSPARLEVMGVEIVGARRASHRGHRDPPSSVDRRPVSPIQGKYYQFADVELLPKPMQQPVPIYLAINPKADRVGGGN